MSLSRNEVTVVQSSTNTTQDIDLVKLISQLGFTACNPVNGCKAATIDIDGMTCISCVRSIEACLSDVKGIKTSDVSLSDNCALVVIDSNIVSIQQICDAINSCGFVAKTRAQSHNDVKLPVKQDDFSKPDSVDPVTTSTNPSKGSCVVNTEDRLSQLKKAIANEISVMGCGAEGGNVMNGLHPTDKVAESNEVDAAQCGSADNEVIISISGMTCDSCVKSVHSCISGLPGVTAVTVSLANGMAYVSLSGNVTSAADVAAAVNDIGFDASVSQAPAAVSTATPGCAANAEVLMAIHGMHCNSCTRAIEDKVSSTVGVHSVVVSLLDETAKIQYNAELISAQQLKQLIEKAGNFEACISSQIGKWTFQLQTFAKCLKFILYKVCILLLLNFIRTVVHCFSVT